VLLVLTRTFSSRTYTPLSSKHLLTTARINGLCHLLAVDLETGKYEQLADDKDVCQIAGDAIHRIDDFSALVVAAGTTTAQSVYRFDIRNPGKFDVIRETSQEKFPAALYSAPERVHIQSQGAPGRDVHGFLWMPRNPDYTAPEGQLPPLIISAHGGPTGFTGSELDVRTQYFTSRGYALLKLNYTGSTGFGQVYRRRLNGTWGIIDADDAAECANHLAKAGCVKPNGIGITGISAGGYNTLQCLVRHPAVFTSGFCVSGISDLVGFDAKTHKLEMSYTNLLICPADTPATERERVYRERSALYHIDSIKAPLYLLHATDDMVVPLDQATGMAEALEKKGQEVVLRIVENEGHSIGKPPNKRLWLEEEEKWWRKTLLS
jgi:dipeptidyl aminopeptidase/acylaminoacyl peptidase